MERSFLSQYLPSGFLDCRFRFSGPLPYSNNGIWSYVFKNESAAHNTKHAKSGGGKSKDFLFYTTLSDLKTNVSNGPAMLSSD